MNLIKISKVFLYLVLLGPISTCWSESKKGLPKSEKPSIEDTISPEVLDLIDDQPTSCVGMIYLPNGESMCDLSEATGKYNETCLSMKKIEERQKLPKSWAAIGGVELKGDSPTLRRVTVKKTEVYDSPNGKVIDSYPEKFALLLEGKKGAWVFVRGYWSRNCDTGWISEDALMTKSRKELEALGIFGH